MPRRSIAMRPPTLREVLVLAALFAMPVGAAHSQVVKTLQPSKPNNGKTSSFQRVLASPDGTRLLAHGHKDITVWDVASGRIVLSLNGDPYYYSEYDVAWLAGRRQL